MYIDMMILPYFTCLYFKKNVQPKNVVSELYKCINCGSDAQIWCKLFNNIYLVFACKLEMEGVVRLNGRFVGVLTAGVLIGAAASVMMIPQMDVRTRRRLNRTSRKFAHSAGNIINDLRDYAK
jgi:hypothetical protein